MCRPPSRYAVLQALKPARARMVAHARDWPWSSVRAHRGGRDDGLVHAAPLQGRVGRCTGLIAPGAEPEVFAVRRAAAITMLTAGDGSEFGE